MKFIRYFLLLILICVLVLSIFSYKTYQDFIHYKNPKTVQFKIKKGSSVKAIAKTLKEHDIISNSFVFLIYLKITEKTQGLKAGEYLFKKDLTVKDVIDIIENAKTVKYQFTIPEGYRYKDICRVLSEKKELMTNVECLKLCQRTDFLKHKTKMKNLEGFLYPETYFYESDDSPEEIIKMMVNMFYKVVGKERIQKAKEKGMSLDELVTFASIVEKETAYSPERPLIAGVFYNRLKANMLLQTDPTVIYGIKNYDGNIRKKDLETDHSYNTYTRLGLPPGPIASPGIESIDAVLNPFETKAYYFVAKGEGKHYFSRDVGQHNRAVRYFILKRGRKPEPGEEEKFFEK